MDYADLTVLQEGGYLDMPIAEAAQKLGDKVLSLHNEVEVRELLDALHTEVQDVGLSISPRVSDNIKRYRQCIFKIKHKLKTTPHCQVNVPASVRSALAVRVRVP
ncbi:hypothetical protein WJX72_007130 [[Myrmecia] bisecta]|uniref:Uncharacterized protein n=1 Tax=[Myrmecia] bisecta TaxID=41462 RepID=A0AAW1R768_9CHLO